MEKLISEIKKFIKVDQELEAALKDAFVGKEYKKTELIVREGQFNVPLIFIDSGVLRCFNLKEAKEITNDFFLEDTFVTDFSALMNELPARQNFEVLEDAFLYTISKSTLLDLSGRYPILREWGAKMAEVLFTDSVRKQALLKSDSPEERYLSILDNQPILLQKIPLHYIASYLGITQVHLSRIRKKIG